jgi:hypothetical protein
MGGGTVAGGEAFAGNDESGSIGAEVEEELAEDVDCKKGVIGDFVISETEDAE